MKEKFVKVYTDGASSGNPGPSGIGIVVLDEKDNIIHTHKKFLGIRTNNYAEYSALIEAVKLLQKLEIIFDVINFYADSSLLVNQINGEYKIKHKDLIQLSLEFWKEIKKLNKRFSITYIPRDQNKQADKLAVESIKENVKKKSSTKADRNLLIKS